MERPGQYLVDMGPLRAETVQAAKFMVVCDDPVGAAVDAFFEAMRPAVTAAVGKKGAAAMRQEMPPRRLDRGSPPVMGSLVPLDVDRRRWSNTVLARACAATSVDRDMRVYMVEVDVQRRPGSDVRLRCSVGVSVIGLGPTTMGMVTTVTEAYDPLRQVPIVQTDFMATPMHAVYRSLWDRGLVERRDGVDAGTVLALGGACPRELEVSTPDPSELEDGGFRARVWDVTVGEMSGAFPQGIWELCQRDKDLGRARGGAPGAGGAVPVDVDTLSELNGSIVELTNGARDALAERDRALDEAAAARRDLDELRRATDARIALLTDAAASARSAADEARGEADSYREAAEGAAEAVGRAEAALADARAREEQAERALSEVDRALSERDDEIRRLRSLLAAAPGPSGEGDAGPGTRPMAVSEMDAVPRTLGQVLDLAERAWPDRLEVLPSAHESAERWEGRDVDRPWRALRAVAEVLWTMHFEEGVPEEYRAFADATGFSLAMQESDTVCQSQRLRDARTFLWGGRRVFMPAHIAVTGGRTDTSIRMHLAFDEVARKVVIGHLGRHLPNTMT